jgi:D-tyrosyl-tRNA(Tyr) deacylase
VNGNTVGEIGKGLLILLGIETGDTSADADYLSVKTAALRIFDDEAGKMNLNVKQVNGAVLVVSQFTLCAETKRGMRPSFDRAARPEVAKPLYETFVERLRQQDLRVETGIFQASMEVSLTNDGPVTLICESKRS